jgi:hypothetical protein
MLEGVRMELKDFIKATLNDVVAAINESNEATNGSVSPFFNSSTERQNLIIGENKKERFVMTEVRFEVSIQAEETSSGSGKAKVTVIPALLKVDAGGEIASKNTAVNKICFSVPVKLSSSEHPKITPSIMQGQ